MKESAAETKKMADALRSLNTSFATLNRNGDDIAKKLAAIKNTAKGMGNIFLDLGAGAEMAVNQLGSLSKALGSVATGIKSIPNKGIVVSSKAASSSSKASMPDVDPAALGYAKKWSEQALEADKLTNSYTKVDQAGRKTEMTLKSLNGELVSGKVRTTELTKAQISQADSLGRTQRMYASMQKALAGATLKSFVTDGSRAVSVYEKLNKAGQTVQYTIEKYKGVLTDVKAKVTDLTSAQKLQVEQTNAARAAYVAAASDIAKSSLVSSKTDGQKMVQVFEQLNAAGQKVRHTVASMNGEVVKYYQTVHGTTEAEKRHNEQLTRANAEYNRLKSVLATATMTSERFSSATAKQTQVYEYFNAAGQKVQSTLTKMKGQLVDVSTKTADATEKSKNFLVSWTSIAKLFAGQMMYRGISMILQGVRESAMAAKDLSISIAAIQSISQEAGYSSKAFLDDIVSVSNETGSSLLDVSEAMYEITSNQIAMGASAVEVVREASKAAIVMRSSTLEAVQLGSTVINAYGKQVSDLPEIYAQIFKAIEVGRFVAKDIASDFGLLAVPAAQLGVSVQEVLGSLAGITNQGVDTSKTVTQLRNMFMALLKPSDEMNKLLLELGVTSGDTAIQLYKWPGLLQQIENRTRGSNTELAALFPNIRGLAGALAQTGSGLDIVQKATKNITESSAAYAKAYDIMLNAPGKQAEIFANTISNTLVPAFNKLLNVLSNSGVFNNILWWFKNMEVAAPLGLSIAAAEDMRQQFEMVDDLIDKWGRERITFGKVNMTELDKSFQEAFDGFLQYQKRKVEALTAELDKVNTSIKVMATTMREASASFSEGIDRTSKSIENMANKAVAAREKLSSEIGKIQGELYFNSFDQQLSKMDLGKKVDTIRAEQQKLFEGAIKSGSYDEALEKIDELEKRAQDALKDAAKLQDDNKTLTDGKKEYSKSISEKNSTKEAKLQTEYARQKSKLDRESAAIAKELVKLNKEQAYLDNKYPAENEQGQKTSKVGRSEQEELDDRRKSLLVKQTEIAAKAKEEQVKYNEALKETKKTQSDIQKQIDKNTEAMGSLAKAILDPLALEKDSLTKALEIRQKMYEMAEAKEKKLLDLQTKSLALKVRDQALQEQMKAFELGSSGDIDAYYDSGEQLMKDRAEWAKETIEVARESGASEATIASLEASYEDALNSTHRYTQLLMSREEREAKLEAIDKETANLKLEYNKELAKLKDLVKAREDSDATIRAGLKKIQSPVAGLQEAAWGGQTIRDIKYNMQNPQRLMTQDWYNKIGTYQAGASMNDPASKANAPVLEELKALIKQSLDLTSSEAVFKAQEEKMKVELDRLKAAFPVDQAELDLMRAVEPAVTAIDGLTKAVQELTAKFPAHEAAGGSINYGTDTIPAMLTKGEFVVNARAAARFAPVLRAINGTSRFAEGGSVGGVNIGDVNISMNGGANSAQSALVIGRQLQRLCKQGLLSFN
jgi:DNA repair exonuclease SbcCD ATPase subunit